MCAVEKVRDRLRRTVAVLEASRVPYAVCCGHAVAVWVSRAGQGGVRNSTDVNNLLRRTDLDAAKTAMEAAGFVYRHAASIDMFLDGPGAKARDAVHAGFAAEKVRSECLLPAPDVTESEAGDSFRVLALEALVRMKLTSNRDKDRTHLRDFIDVGLIDATWPVRFAPELGARLQHILDTPDG
ncbi:hypothetical protein [Frigoriglobus tundricola]|uniref:Uncharacterized protein n=1 Tax=Frigoriglobus tundricola TaxID=2774151 RepID=A0A6M5YIT2_9BACT|nr:hypothetical protein [Frigoriglobus tundricola]QJW92882.1 hypothetical protein FTUN_0379 [Frigoriglobus tundricola]